MRFGAGETRIHHGWGVAILAIVVWHGIDTVRHLGPDYLFSMCYLANALLAIGIIIASPPLIGVGFGWALIGLPLWTVDAWLSESVSPSSVVLHLAGVGVGILAVRHIELPRRLVLLAIPTGLLSYVLARAFTQPCHNINAAFRVQAGWEAVFADRCLYFLVQAAAYTSVFLLLPAVTDRLRSRKAADQA